MTPVLDTSVAVAWRFGDAQTPDPMRLLDRVTEAGAVAPVPWPLEVNTTLPSAQRRRPVDAAGRDRLTSVLRDPRVNVDPHTAAQAWAATVLLAERHGLTVYGAACPELAPRRDLPLAALDGDLRAAAARAGRAVVPDLD